MSKLIGNDYQLWVESSTPGAFNRLKGQGSCEVTRDAGSIDLTTKDDAGYGSSAPGLKSLKVSLDMLANLPDAQGYTRLETLCNASPVQPFNIQIRKGGQAGGTSDVVFAGSVYGNLDSTSFGQNEGVKLKVSFSANGAPTTDALA